LVVYDISDYYLYAVKLVDLSAWEERGSSWEDASGYIRSVDTIYSCDLEIKTPARQWMGRVNKYTDGKEDLDSVYTNPRNEEGLIQPDIFPDQPEVYAKRVKYGDQTYLTGLVSFERGGVLALKDQSISEIVVDENPGGTPLTNTRTVSERVGNQSPIYGYIKTPYGVFFVAQDDIYLYNGELIGLTKDDWKEVFRAISNATKQASIVWYRPDEGAVFFKLGSDVYAYYLDSKENPWREVSYAAALDGYTVKRDGTFVWWIAGGTAYKFDATATDGGTAIQSSFDTGIARIAPIGEAVRIDELYVVKGTDSTSGTLHCTLNLIYNGTTVASVTGISGEQDTKRIRLAIPTEYNGVCDSLQLIYNNKATGYETGAVEIQSIEVWGTPFPKAHNG
jgi:hypothetical protein